MDFSVIIGPIFTTIAIISIVIGLIVATIKSTIARYCPMKSWVYNELILPTLPYFIALLIYIIARFVSVDIIPAYQCFIGASASSYFYRVYRSYLKKATENLEE